MQKVNISKRTTSNYIGSVYTNDPSFEAQIKQAREHVKAMNKHFKDYGITMKMYGKQVPLRYTIALKPREAKVVSGERAYTRHGDLIGGIANAKRIDIYVRTF